MVYIATVTNSVYADDFSATFHIFNTLEEAQAFKKAIDAEGDYFTDCDIYEATCIT